MRARATLEADGVRFQYRFRNRSEVAYDMVYAVTDPRLTALFHDPRLERTYVHYPEGFALVCALPPARPPPRPAGAGAGADGITYYNTARAVDQPFIATLSTDQQWV